MDNKKLNGKQVKTAHVAWRVVQIQFLFSIIMSACAFIFYSLLIAQSILLGCLTIALPTLILVCHVFKSRNQAGAQLLRAFYRGEALKWLLTIILFVFVMRFGHIHPGAYFIGLVGGLLTYWVGFFLLFKEEQKILVVEN